MTLSKLNEHQDFDRILKKNLTPNTLRYDNYYTYKTLKDIEMKLTFNKLT